MHDVHRDSLIYKGGKQKRRQEVPSRGEHGHHRHGRHEDQPHDDHMHPYDATAEQDHEHVHEHAGGVTHGHAHRHFETGIDGHVHGDGHGQPHGHGHGDAHEHGHSHGDEEERSHGYHGHAHEHDESAYDRHDRDMHAHGHEREAFEDHAYTHVHDHAHQFYHGHHHTHHPEHTSLVHRIFNDPVRDFFGAALMAVLIFAWYRAWVPSPIAEGLLLCAALIGIYPLTKRGLVACLKKRQVTPELILGAALIAGLCFGKFLAVSLVTLFMLIGSFFRLNFSWKDE